jgi:peptidoglycan/xylan/chitin deacetylase (PgdA/CDA1 family)
VARALFRTPVLAAMRRRQRRRGGTTVLMYHGFGDPRFMDRNLFVGAARFKDQVGYLAGHYQLVPLEEVVARLAAGRALPPGGVAVTIDDGYRNVYELAAPVLRAAGCPATVFVSTGPLETGRSLWPATVHYWFSIAPAGEVRVSLPSAGAGGAAEGPREHLFQLDTPSQRTKARRVALRAIQGLAPPFRVEALARLAGALGVSPAADPFSLMPMLSWDETRALVRDGLSVGGHTVSHPSLTTLGPAEARAEVVECRKRLEDELGRPVTTFAYPFGMERDWNGLVREVVREAGYVGACTALPGVVRDGGDAYALARALVGDWTLPHFALEMALV